MLHDFYDDAVTYQQNLTNSETTFHLTYTQFSMNWFGFLQNNTSFMRLDQR